MCYYLSYKDSSMKVMGAPAHGERQDFTEALGVIYIRTVILLATGSKIKTSGRRCIIEMHLEFSHNTEVTLMFSFSTVRP